MTDSPVPDEQIDTAADNAAFPGWKRNVSLLVAGQTATMFGGALVFFAVMWHLTLATGSGWVLSMTIVAGVAPQALVSIFGGVWADRYNRKMLIICADVARAVITLVLAGMLFFGESSVGLILAALAIRSALGGIQAPAAGAILPQIIPASQLLRVNGLRETLGALDSVIAPGVAAVLYATGGLPMVFVIDVATTVVSVALMAFIPLRKAVSAAVSSMDDGASAARPSYFGELAGGFRFVFGNRVMRWVTLFVTTCFLFLSAPAVLTTLMIQRTFGGETWMLATNEIFWFGGMMAAGSLITILSRRLGSTVRMIILGTLAAAVSTAAIGFSGGSIWLFFALGTINGITFTFVATPMTTYFQDNTPEDKLGRVFGVVGLVTTLAMPASLLIGGPLADRIPVEHVFVWGGVALFAVVGTFFAIPTARRSILKAMRPAPTSDVVHDDEATGATTGEGDDSGTSNAPEDVTLAA